MTKRDARMALQAARDTAWLKVLSYERAYAVQSFPEQRDGRLSAHDVEAGRLRGVVNGLDAARAALGL